MTSSSNTESVAAEAIDDQQIIDFLRQRPSFLDDHPDLLAALSIPHDSGGAVSLVERQLEVLRRDNSRLTRQLDSLVTTARQNERLNANIHALALSLMNAVGPQAIFACLEQRLIEDFGADHVAVRVFADANSIEGNAAPQFVGAENTQRKVFSGLLNNATMQCGPLSDAYHEVLFDPVRGRLSAVMMPLGGGVWDGILVIASQDAERYSADMGTEFLTYLKDVVALVIDPWIKR